MKKASNMGTRIPLCTLFRFPQGTASAQSYVLNWTVDDVEVEGNVTASHVE